MPLKLRPTKPQPRRRPAPPAEEMPLFAAVVPPAPLAYSGWLRTSADGRRWSPWRRVCGPLAKYWSCWPGLLAADAGAAQYVERAVVAEGEKP